jgi:hypothetical protein
MRLFASLNRCRRILRPETDLSDATGFDLEIKTFDRFYSVLRVTSDDDSKNNEKDALISTFGMRRLRNLGALASSAANLVQRFSTTHRDNSDHERWSPPLARLFRKLIGDDNEAGTSRR